MIHDLAATLKIAAVVLLSAAALATVAGFYDGRDSARRAFWLAFALGSLVGCLQIFEARYLVWVFGAYGLLAGLSAWRWRVRRAKAHDQAAGRASI